MFQRNQISLCKGGAIFPPADNFQMAVCLKTYFRIIYTHPPLQLVTGWGRGGCLLTNTTSQPQNRVLWSSAPKSGKLFKFTGRGRGTIFLSTSNRKHSLFEHVNPLNIFKNFNKHSRKLSCYSLKPWKDFLKVVPVFSRQGGPLLGCCRRWELLRPCESLWSRKER